MPPPLLHLQDVRLSFGGTPLLAGAEIPIGSGDRVALVGRNGSGKSTLLKIAAGLVLPDSGSVFLQPGTTVRYLPQEPDMSSDATALDHVLAGLGPADDAHRAAAVLDRLGVALDAVPRTLSGGEKRRVALARALAPSPDILLLDEPTNHLDLPTIEWLESELAASRSALILISHDRRFLTSLSRATVWIDRGIARRIEQGFGAFESWRDQVLEEEETARHKADRKIVREEDWLRYGVTARRKRNVRRLAELHTLRAERRQRRAALGNVRMAAAEAEGGGTTVIAAENLNFAHGDRVLVRNVSTRVLRGDRIGIVGPNGAGKTTLLNILTGRLPPDSGTVRLGTGLAMHVLDQSRAQLDPALGLAATLTGGRGDTVFVGGQPRHVMSYLKDFLFNPAQANTPVGTLSGGERARLALALAFAAPSNLLVLDEPTNDLDLETLDLLQEVCGDYGGTILLVSHDRDVLDRVVTTTIAAEGDGVWTEYAGGYSDMLAQRGTSPARPAPARPAPKAAPPPPRAAKKGLSFVQQHTLEALPGRIAALQAEIARHNATLADPALFARDRARFDKASAALACAESDLAAAEEQWLELELLREEG